MLRNILSLVLLTAAAITAFTCPITSAVHAAPSQQLNYEIVETRPLPPNTYRVVLSKKTGTSAGFVKIAMGMRTLPNNGRMEDRVQVFDESGNSVHAKEFELRMSGQQGSPDAFEIPVSSVRSTSKHGNYFALRTIIREITKEQNALHLHEIFDSNGKKLWEEESEKIYDSQISQFAISHIDGSGIKMDGASGTITFYSPEGAVLREVREINTFDLGNDFNAVFSDDGKLRIVNVIEFSRNPQARNARTIAYNEIGEELWRFQGDNVVSNLMLGISPDNNFVLTSDRTPGQTEGRTAYILDGEGNLLYKFEGIGFGNIAFSADSKTAVSTGFLSVIVDLLSGQILHRFGNVASFDIATEKNLLAVIARNRLVVLTFDGSSVFSYGFGQNDIFTGRRTPNDPIMSDPAVQISDDGSEIVVSLGRRTVRFRLQ